MTAHPKRAPMPSSDDDRLDRADRVRAMLERWAREDVSAEPQWQIEDVLPFDVGEDSSDPIG